MFVELWFLLWLCIFDLQSLYAWPCPHVLPHLLVSPQQLVGFTGQNGEQILVVANESGLVLYNLNGETAPVAARSAHQDAVKGVGIHFQTREDPVGVVIPLTNAPPLGVFYSLASGTVWYIKFKQGSGWQSSFSFSPLLLYNGTAVERKPTFFSTPTTVPSTFSSEKDQFFFATDTDLCCAYLLRNLQDEIAQLTAIVALGSPGNCGPQSGTAPAKLNKPMGIASWVVPSPYERAGHQILYISEPQVHTIRRVFYVSRDGKTNLATVTNLKGIFRYPSGLGFVGLDPQKDLSTILVASDRLDLFSVIQDPFRSKDSTITNETVFHNDVVAAVGVFPLQNGSFVFSALQANKPLQIQCLPDVVCKKPISPPSHTSSLNHTVSSSVRTRSKTSQHTRTVSTAASLSAVDRRARTFTCSLTTQSLAISKSITTHTISWQPGNSSKAEHQRANSGQVAVLISSVLNNEVAARAVTTTSGGSAIAGSFVGSTTAVASTKLSALSGVVACGEWFDDDEVQLMEHPLPGPVDLFGTAIAGPAVVTSICFIVLPLLGISATHFFVRSLQVRKTVGIVGTVMFSYFCPGVAKAAGIIVSQSESALGQITGIALAALCLAVCFLALKVASIAAFSSRP